MQTKFKKSGRFFAVSLTMAILITACVKSDEVKTKIASSEAASEETEVIEVETAETEISEEAETEEIYTEEAVSEETETEEASSEEISETMEDSSTEEGIEDKTTAAKSTSEVISLNPSWKYADFSKINDGTATLYYADASKAKGITVCINAGHGTSGGEKYKTQCHPDGTPKVTGGSTAEGSTTATAVSSGTTMLDGTPEAKVTLKVALAAKSALLKEGYNVLMIRETDDVQLDNIARTVIANNNADCHIAIHYDSSESDKGAFYCSVPDNKSYRSMEPVSSNWQEHERLGKSLIDGLRSSGIKISGSGEVPIDLTQTSYSTVPSIDLEVGDRASNYSEAAVYATAAGIVEGLNIFFE